MDTDSKKATPAAKKQDKKPDEKLDTTKLNIHQKLALIQDELEVPKSRHNSHGNFNYRSSEDILAALKPLLKKYNCVLLPIEEKIDKVVDRDHITATATILDLDKPGDKISASGTAQYAEQQKGMNAAQLTGSTSSYAKKYALNNLLMIDDAREMDDTTQSPSAEGVAKKPKKVMLQQGTDEWKEAVEEYKTSVNHLEKGSKERTKAISDFFLKYTIKQADQNAFKLDIVEENIDQTKGESNA